MMSSPKKIVIGQNHHPRPMFSIWGNGWSCRSNCPFGGAHRQSTSHEGNFDARAESTRAYGTSWRVVVHHRLAVRYIHHGRQGKVEQRRRRRHDGTNVTDFGGAMEFRRAAVRIHRLRKARPMSNIISGSLFFCSNNDVAAVLVCRRYVIDRGGRLVGHLSLPKKIGRALVVLVLVAHPRCATELDELGAQGRRVEQGRVGSGDYCVARAMEPGLGKQRGPHWRLQVKMAMSRAQMSVAQSTRPKRWLHRANHNNNNVKMGHHSTNTKKRPSWIWKNWLIGQEYDHLSPFYYSRHQVERAELIFLPYRYLF
jgi:hypothetical protein